MADATCGGGKRPGPFGEFYGVPNSAGNRPIRLNAAGQAAVTAYLADPRRAKEPAGVCRANRRAAAAYGWLCADDDRRRQAQDAAVEAVVRAFCTFDPAKMARNADGTPSDGAPYVAQFISGDIVDLAARLGREPRARGGDDRGDRDAGDPVQDAAEPARYEADPDAPDAARLVRECLADPAEQDLVLARFGAAGAPGFGAACRRLGLSRQAGEQRVRELVALLGAEYAGV